ncbi:MAG: response regulator [Bacteroides sp.]|jgi:DNA-binding response OmpR family regulator|nr:response regulator [Bacteroides sp.]MCI1683670.1 response regulator [Bacteroides sp.]
MKILLALDNNVYAEYISLRLKRKGHEVAIAPNGLVASDLLEKETWDKLIIGIVIEYFSGLEVIERMDEDKRRSMQIIIVTRIRNEKLKRNAYALGVTDFLLLPLDTDALMAKIG